MARDRILYQENYASGSRVSAEMLERLKVLNDTDRRQLVDCLIRSSGIVARGDDELSFMDIRLVFRGQ